MKNRCMGLFLLLCLTLVGAIACNPFGGGDIASQQLVKVVRGDLTISVEGTGNIVVSNETHLKFAIDGRIAEINVDEGDTVSKGDVLATLDSSDLELALAQQQAAAVQSRAAIVQAKAAVDEAEYNLEYLITIVRASRDRVEVAEIQLDAAKAQLEAAELQLTVAEQSVAHAQKQLAEVTLFAPFDGLVASVDADEDDSISPTATIIHIIDPTSMELKAEVDEIDIAGVKLGQRALIEIDVFPTLQLEGEVISISPISVETAGVVLYEVTIGFDVVEGFELRDGMSATADIVLNERNKVLLVPSAAVTQDSQGNATVKVMIGESIEERPVVAGLNNGSETEIKDGLAENDVVVLER